MHDTQHHNGLPVYLTEGEAFRFDRLVITDINNEPVLKLNNPAMAGEEICLLHRDIPSGDDYVSLLGSALSRGVTEHRELPVVRFADGEYAFYANTLGCNGLYEQAESAAAIKRALPSHIAALQRLSTSGILAPLIFPGNTRGKKKLSLLPWRRREPSATTFLEFLQGNGIRLTARNYLPFYVVYAYLTSPDFAHLMDGKKLCILNSEYNAAGCRRWFEQFSSRPEITYCAIPAAYTATRWESYREDILQQIPSDTDLCLVGAGVGALTVCVDAAERFSLPAIDAGHVLNMMNEREDKSKGPRLYTLRGQEASGPRRLG
jgi:hypothetical protein